MREHVGERPAAVAAEEAVPAVVVFVLAARIDHRIDGGTAAEDRCLANFRCAAAEVLLRHRLVHLDDRAAGDALHPCRRHRQVERRQPRRPRRSALDDQHAGAERLDEPCRRNAGGRTAADNDVVVGPTDGALRSVTVRLLLKPLGSGRWRRIGAGALPRATATRSIRVRRETRPAPAPSCGRGRQHQRAERCRRRDVLIVRSSL